MHRLAAALLLLLPCAASAADVQGVIASNTTWSGSVRMVGDVVVPAGVTLTVAQGTNVFVAATDAQAAGADTAHVELLVDGALVIQGSSGAQVSFAGEGGAQSWVGLHVRKGGSASIANASLHDAVTAVQLDDSGTITSSLIGGATGVLVKGGTAHVTNTSFATTDTAVSTVGGASVLSGLTINGGATGVSLSGGTCSLEHSLVTGTTSAGLYLNYTATSGAVDHCTIAGNAGDGIAVNLFFLGTIAVSLTNSIVASNAGHGIGLTGFPSSNNGTFSHNDLWDNAGGDLPFLVPLDATSFSANPLFVTGGFRITEHSPARMAADDGGDIGVFPYTGDPTPGGLKGTLFGDTVLSGTVSIEGDLTIPVGSSLTVQAGANLQFGNLDAMKAGLDTARIELIVLGTLAVQGTAQHPALFAGTGDQSWYGVRIRPGSTASLTSASVSNAVIGVTLAENGTVAHSTFSSATGIRVTAGSATLLDDLFTGNGTAGVEVAAGTATISSSRFTQAALGLAVDGGTALVDHTLIDHCAAGISATSGGATLSHLTVADNTNDGVSFSTGSAPLNAFALRDSIVSGSGGRGVYANSTVSGLVQTDHNDVYGNTGGNYSGAVTSGAGSISLSPQYVSDYRLGPASPCRGAGNGNTDLGAFSSVATGNIDHLAVLPAQPTADAGASVTFSAIAYDAAGNVVSTPFAWSAKSAAGTIDQNGVLTVACAPGAVSGAVTASAGGKSASASLTIQIGAPHQLILLPSSATVAAGGSKDFSAEALDKCGNTTSAAVSWSASSGTIDQQGHYTAPCATGSVSGAVTASAGALQKSADVTVVAGVLAALHVQPENASVSSGGTQQFAANGTDACLNQVPAGGVSWAVDAAAGSISPGGLFTAGSTAGTYALAASAGSLHASTHVTVTTGGSGVDSVQLDPQTVTLEQGATQAFTAVARDASGNPISASISWSVAHGGGTIDSSGHFTAGTTPGTYTATVVASAGSKSAAATVIVKPGAAHAISLSPASVTIAPGGITSFSAQVTDAAGNPTSDAVTFTMANSAAGAISPAGVFVAGSTAGAYPDAVLASAGALQAHAGVTISASALSQLVVQPGSTSVRVGAALAFSCSGLDATGNSVPVTAAWAVLKGGGTISGAGLFVAGHLPGTWVNTVQCRASGLAATATVITTPGPAVLIAVTPSHPTLAPAAVQHFAGTATDAYGNETAQGGLTWQVDARAGSIDALGNFTAGASPGDYADAVVATSGFATGTASVRVSAQGGSDGGTGSTDAGADGGVTAPPQLHGGCSSTGPAPWVAILAGLLLWSQRRRVRN